MNKCMCCLNLLLIMLTSITLMNRCWADSEIKMHGTVYKVSCVINNDQPVDVLFGNIGVNKIDGTNYAQPIPLLITCDDDFSGQFSLKISGTASDFDATAVQTTINDLAIQIQQNGTPVPLNQPFIVSNANLPILTAVPVSKPSSVLNEGTFQATATLIMEVL